MPESDKVTLTLTKDWDGKMLFRLPEWLASDAVIQINGGKQNYTVTGAGEGKNGYAVLEGGFLAGTVIELTLPMEVRAHALPDSEAIFAFRYGPVVLSALLGTEKLITSVTGVDVTIPKDRILSGNYLPSESETVTVLTGSVQDFMKNINSYMVRDSVSEKLKFMLENTDSRLVFVTHYRQHTERYGLYFRYIDTNHRLSHMSDENLWQ